MSSEWQTFRLGEVTKFSSGSTPSKQEPAYWNGGIPWVSAKDMKSFFLSDSEDKITEQAIAAGAKIAAKGSVLLLTRGMTLLNDVPICLLKGDSSFNQDVKAIQTNTPVLVGDYLPYLLLGHKSELQALVDLAGHGTGRLATDLLLSFEIALPPPQEQKAIAHALGTLDDKIELNRKTNETLEAMAKALFKSWFVDFDPVKAKAEGRPTGLPAEISDLFPDSFEDSELGEIPSGWEMEALGEILDVDKGVSYKGDFLSDTEGLPMVNLGCFAGGGSFRAEKMKFYAGEYREKHLVSAGDLLVANTDMTQNRIILGAPIIVPSWRGRDKFLFSHHTFAIRFRHSKSAFTRFIYFTLLKPSFRQVAAGHATGTTVLALPKDGITDYQTVIPPACLLNVFAAKVEALYQKCQALTEQCELLAKTRDALLPKLISGEIRIPDAEKMLEEVGV